VRLHVLEVTDFGPYRGTQSFSFAPEPGVELLWGENGRGKTSLLNALRWVLFGIVLGRGSSRIDLGTVGNRDDEDSDTVRPFKAVLTFSHAGHFYKLTRAYRDESGSPGGNDFRTRPILVKDGNVLGPDERERELATMLPEQIARFFLFDAELLQEYEQLLAPGTDAGEKLKASIERLLGLPVLTQARDDVAAHLNSARTAQAKAAQKDQATRALGNDLQIAADTAASTRINVGVLTEQVEGLQNDVNELEKTLTSNSRYKTLLGERNILREEVQRRTRRTNDLADELAGAAGGTWRAVLSPVVARELQLIEAQTDAAGQRLQDAMAARSRAAAVSSGVCPTCQQSVDSVAAQELGGHTDTEVDPDDVQADLAQLRGRRDVLRRLRDDGERIARLEDDLTQARVNLSDAEGQLRALQVELDGAPPGTAENIAALLDELGGKRISLDNTRQRLQKTREDLRRENQAVEKLSEKLARLGTASTGSEDRKVQMLVALHGLLVAAVTEFRDRLRDSVEAEASKVFRMLSAEQDYDRLRINDQYGLTILHANGAEVLNRSSGYEHVVALSLIAALQRCSPMSGPIITDSPFGRLDGTHKRHVLQALPQITDQVLLLVHDEELDRQGAIDELGTHLVGEHHLRKVSARHTAIESGAHL